MIFIIVVIIIIVVVIISVVVLVVVIVIISSIEICFSTIHDSIRVLLICLSGCKFVPVEDKIFLNLF